MPRTRKNSRSRKHGRKGGGEGTEKRIKEEKEARKKSLGQKREARKAKNKSNEKRKFDKDIASFDNMLANESARDAARRLAADKKQEEQFGFSHKTSSNERHERYENIVANLKPYKWSTPKVKSKSKSKRVSMKQKKPTRFNRFKKWFKGSKAKTIKLSKNKSHGKVVSNPLLDESVQKDSQFKNYDIPSSSSSLSKKSFGLNSKKFLPSPNRKSKSNSR
jgi:hypothetical protein